MIVEADDDLGGSERDAADAGTELTIEDDGVRPGLSDMRRIKWINFMLGAAVLLPWNALITAMPYFLSRLVTSRLQATFPSYLSTTFTISNFCFLAHATMTSRQNDLTRQIRRSLLALTLLVFLLTLSTFTPLPAPLFFSLVLLNGICQASAGSYLQSAVIALASLFGPGAIQPIMTGQAAVGVVVSLIQVVSAAAGIRAGPQSATDDPEAATRAAFIFFAVSTLFLIMTIVCHAWLVRMPAYKAIVLPFEMKKGVIAVDEERVALVGDNLVDPLPAPALKSRLLSVLKMNGEYNFAVAYVFVVTLCVFPVITAAVTSVHPASHPLLFTAFHFLAFNVGDLIGRYLPIIPQLQFWSSRPLLYMSLVRTLFVPLFLMCNVQRGTAPVTGNVIINSDALFFLILLLFAVSNGYLGSLIMMAAPSLEHNPRLKVRPEDVDTAATVNQFCLVGGLVIGGFSSFGVRGAICGCNPFAT